MAFRFACPPEPFIIRCILIRRGITGGVPAALRLVRHLVAAAARHSAFVFSKLRNKMQSDPGAAIWRIERNIRVVIDSDPFAQLCETVTSSTKPEMHNIAFPSEGDRAKATSNTCGKFGF